MTPTSPAIGGQRWIFAQHFPKLGPDLTDGTPYTTNLHVFLRPWVGSMNIIKMKTLGSIKNKKNAHDMRRGGGGCPPPPPPFDTPPPAYTGAHRNLTKFLGSSLKLVPRPPFWSLFGLMRSPKSAQGLNDVYRRQQGLKGY